MNTDDRISDRFFFSGISVWFLLITFTGFSQSFYLSNYPEPLPLPLKIHGVLFSLWILLFFVQTSLISLKKVRVHMYLGIFGLVLLIALIPAGVFPVLFKVSMGMKTVDHGGFNLATLFVGYTLVLTGLGLRKRPYFHKRLMLFATLIFTTAAVDRVSMLVQLEQSQVFRKSMVLFPCVALFGFDYFKTRKLHWFDLLPVLLILALFYLSDYFWFSSAGQWLMEVLVSLI
jgi:hypothetical protein